MIDELNELLFKMTLAGVDIRRQEMSALKTKDYVDGYLDAIDDMRKFMAEIIELRERK